MWIYFPSWWSALDVASVMSRRYPRSNWTRTPGVRWEVYVEI